MGVTSVITKNALPTEKSDLATESGVVNIFLAKVQLPAGLKTTYGKVLAYKTGLTASADIITDDTRLLGKLFYQLRKVANGR